MTFNSDCDFCEIVRRRSFQGGDEHTVWFTPLDPVVIGHRLFVPRKHFEHDDVGASKAVGLAFKAAHDWFGQYGSAESFNLITSFGAAATQTVPHLHIHLVPRYPGDELQLPWGLPHG